MTCYHPITGYRAREATKTGKYKTVFNPTQGYLDLPRTIACGRCIGCRLEYSRQWAIRCMHEASLHEHNCLITLTYAPAHLPHGGTLVKKDFQDFMKRFRKRIEKRILYYYCGEYGEKYGRPHYHACIFGYDFPDKLRVEDSPSGSKQWSSELLDDLWGLGRARLGSVNFDSAGYVARYITKKIKGKDADEHYKRIDEDTGEIFNILPEYTDMSRRPAVAANWYSKYSSDVYPSDAVIVKGKKVKPPRFYDTRYELEYPDDFEILKRRRKSNAVKYKEHSTPDRLEVREKIQQENFKKLKRGYENGI